MDQLIAVLFSYAVLLSGLHADHPPTIKLEPKTWFDQQVCQGNANCQARGLYPESGGDVIYLSDDLDFENEVNDSIVVHEIVHYLQHVNHLDQDRTCDVIKKLEFQAYGVQKEYLLREGVISVGVGMSHLSYPCRPLS